jgi:4-hydroxy-tetrahydrodipicolinate reductase
VGGTRVHSVRLPSFVVGTDIIFGGTGERLIMRHDAGESANPYTCGTSLAIRRVAETPGGRLGLASLLFE